QNSGQINVSGSSVRLGTILIGTVAGGTNGLPLTVTFNSNATPAAVQALVRALTYRAVGTNPDTTPRLDGWVTMHDLADDLISAGQLDARDRETFVTTIHNAARDGRFSMRLTMYAVAAQSVT
ncbi:MAG: hypothetical protein Q8K63_07435, partial [Acidimicrobiales bacterium]|nr:hypothetical protein [Acidimicrobiales bacterium]